MLGWVILERIQILSIFSIYKAFHQIRPCGNEKWLIVQNVILTWQTCGQRSSRAVGSKRRGLAFCFSTRICCMFLNLNVKESSIEVCAQLWDLPKQSCCVMVTSNIFCGLTPFLIRSHPAAAFSLQVPKLSTEQYWTFLYISIFRNYIKFARKIKILAFGVCFPQPCSSAGVSCIQTTFGLHPTSWFVSTRTNSMKCVINWIPFRIRVHSRNTQPYLNRGFLWESPMFGVNLPTPGNKDNCISGLSQQVHESFDFSIVC